MNATLIIVELFSFLFAYIEIIGWGPWNKMLWHFIIGKHQYVVVMADVICDINRNNIIFSTDNSEKIH